ncbi:MAG: efflux RND transporter periplasmic adaptor subunit [Saprospirales bacterium]|nr:MAG: efflux RND transporter periplasmic adaptor subunit [Saprospirales bacterium]
MQGYMKNYLILVAALVLFGTLTQGCQNSSAENDIVSLEKKKDKLRQKKNELRKLQDAIGELEAEIDLLENGNKREDVTLVALDTLERKDLRHFSVFQGNVQTRNQVIASAEVSGRIVAIKVREGQTVSGGQLIATLDTEIIDRQIAEVETTLSLARDVFNRQERLWNQNIGSEVQYLEAKNSMQRLERNLETLQTQRSKAVVKAPKSGVLDQLLLREGELVSPGTPVAIIVDMRNLKLAVNVPENHLQSVSVGNQVEIDFPSLSESFNSRISRIGSSIDMENRTFLVEADLPSGHARIKPNLMGRLAINDRTAENAVVIPLNIVQYELGGRAYVYVAVDREGSLRAEKKYVKPGLSYRGHIEIREGLEEGDLLIVRGQQEVSSNQLLTLLD